MTHPPHPKSFIPCEDLLGTAYEASTERSARLTRGQFYTPTPLCDFILGLALSPLTPKALANVKIFDPACGAGAFLLRAYHALSQIIPAETPKKQLSQLYGVDIDPQACHLANHQLIQQAPPTTEATNIVSGSFLAPLPPHFQEMDIVVGNPPYVRQELQKQDTSLILSYLKQGYQDYLLKFPEQASLFSKRLDLYALFFLFATLRLAPTGRLVFVTSNSWRYTEIGKALQSFLLHYYHIEAIIHPGKEAWFPQAAIHPMITVLQKKKEPETSPQQVLSITLKTSLPSILPNPNHPNYWTETLAVCQQLRDGKISPALATVQQELWGFRAPTRSTGSIQSVEEIFETHQSFWKPLDFFGTVRYPLKTGINAFFYVNQLTIDAFGIEPQWLVPVVKSPKDVQGYKLNATHLTTWLFSCTLAKEELEAQGYTGALRYIQWGERQVTPIRQKQALPTPWPQVPSVQGRPAWYQYPPLPPPDFLTCRFFHRRFFFPACIGSLVEDQTFYGVRLCKSYTALLPFLLAVLNSTFSYYWLESLGQKSLGDGVLQFSRKDMARLPIFNPEAFSSKQQLAVVEAYTQMATRPIYAIEEEIIQPDRHDLDEQILSALGIPFSLREEVIDRLLNQIEMRQMLAKERRDWNRIARINRKESESF